MDLLEYREMLSKVVVQGFLTHVKIHLDEAVALWLLIRFGSRVFNITPAPKFCFVSQAPTPPKRRTIEEYTCNGAIVLGCWGSPLDEHAGYGPNGERRERKNDECATSLTMKLLGLENDLALMELVEQVTENDTRGGAKLLELPQMIRIMQDAGWDDVKVLQWVFPFFDAYYDSQMRFFGEVREAYERCVKFVMVPRADGKTLRIAIMMSTSKVAEQVARYARYDAWKKDLSFDITFVASVDTGHFAILTNKKSRVDLRDVARLIRLMIWRKNPVEWPEEWNMKVWGHLESSGTIPEAPSVFYDPFDPKTGKGANWILYGGKSAPDAAPLSEDELNQVVSRLLFGLAYPPFAQDELRYNGKPISRTVVCADGNCSNSVGLECPHHSFGMIVCRAIRYAQMEKERQEESGFQPRRSLPVRK